MNCICNYTHEEIQMKKVIPNLHDNEILSYQVDIHNQSLRMQTKYYDKETCDIIFIGYIAHQFYNVTYSNVIDSIIQFSSDEYIDKNKEVFESGIKNAFPIFAENCNMLKDYLKKADQKIFEIHSIIGLSGFVIAQNIILKRCDSQSI